MSALLPTPADSVSLPETTTSATAIGHGPTWSQEWLDWREDRWSVGRLPETSTDAGHRPPSANLLDEDDVPEWVWGVVGLIGGVLLLLGARCLLRCCCG